MMRCLSCQEALSDREANRKYVNYREIVEPEQRYIGLCDGCLRETDLFFNGEDDATFVEAQGDGDYIGEGE